MSPRKSVEVVQFRCTPGKREIGPPQPRCTTTSPNSNTSLPRLYPTCPAATRYLQSQAHGWWENNAGFLTLRSRQRGVFLTRGRGAARNRNTPRSFRLRCDTSSTALRAGGSSCHLASRLKWSNSVALRARGRLDHPNHAAPVQAPLHSGQEGTWTGATRTQRVVWHCSQYNFRF